MSANNCFELDSSGISPHMEMMYNEISFFYRLLWYNDWNPRTFFPLGKWSDFRNKLCSFPSGLIQYCIWCRALFWIIDFSAFVLIAVSQSYLDRLVSYFPPKSIGLFAVFANRLVFLSIGLIAFLPQPSLCSSFKLMAFSSFSKCDWSFFTSSQSLCSLTQLFIRADCYAIREEKNWIQSI